MGLITVEGPMGSGKTVTTTLLGYDAILSKRVVWANYHLNFPYKVFNQDTFYELNESSFELNNCLILADEGYLLADARRSGTKQNLAFGYYVVQTRKRDVDMVFATHKFDRLDKRVRDAVTMRIACKFKKGIPAIYLDKKTKQPLLTSNGKYIQVMDPKTEEAVWVVKPILTLTIRDFVKGGVDVQSIDPTPIFKYFDTGEIVAVPPRMVQKYAEVA